MPKKILIFRTDRIGDLLLTCPAIVTLKNEIKNSCLTLISSEKNSSYASNLNLFDKIITYPKKNIIKRINFIYQLSKEKFDYVVIFDGKNRSIISSLFIKSKVKIAVFTERKINFLHKFLNIKFISDRNNSLPDIYSKSLELLNIKTSQRNFDFLKKINKDVLVNLNIDNYVHIHLDEKWFKDLYIPSYTDINPTFEDFSNFLNELSNRNNIIISTGLINFKLIDELKDKFFTYVEKNIFLRKNRDKSIYLIISPTFNELEYLILKSKILILCHGGVVHAANSLGVKILDIVEENKSNWYKRYTGHIKDYKLIYRNNFSYLNKSILNEINKIDVKK